MDTKNEVAATPDSTERCVLSEDASTVYAWMKELDTGSTSVELVTETHASYIILEGKCIDTNAINTIMKSMWDNEITSLNGENDCAVMIIQLDPVLHMSLEQFA